MAEPKFEIFKDAKDEYRFRLVAANNRIISTSEGYTRKSSCLKGIKSVKVNAPKASIEDLTGE